MNATPPSSLALQQPMLLSASSSPAHAPDPLRRLDPQTRAAVQALGSARTHRRGDVLFTQGDAHEGIHLILSGTIKSFYVSEEGRELTLGFWTAGHYVGAPQLFGGGQHAWTSVAVSDAHCLWLPGPALRELSGRHADLALALTDALVHKSQCYCALLQLLATHSMRVRLARLLGQLAGRAPPSSSSVIDLSHGELAGMIGSTRQWVSASLARFEAEGWVDRSPEGGYRVRDAEALAAVR